MALDRETAISQDRVIFRGDTEPAMWVGSAGSHKAQP